jgi:hypothetical protein
VKFIILKYPINKPMLVMGLIMFALTVLLTIYLPFNEHIVLGINSMFKPIKFAISIGVYALTFALLLPLWQDQKTVNKFVLLAIVTMVYEQAIITGQALRGSLSHFNNQKVPDRIMYMLMGVMITWLTVYTLILTIRFISQKSIAISKPLRLSIIYGLLLFVIFSFWGGLMSALNTHTYGGPMGGKGLPLVNWSIDFGDLRVAHFFGLHAIQIIPLFGIFISSIKTSQQLKVILIKTFSLIYLAFLTFTALQAFRSIPFISF